jgi:DNA-binding transcriptional ArsR family regulator
MPKKARPASSAELEDSVEALGSMLRAGIIGYLRSSGPAGRAEIARALELRPVTVAKALSSLHSAGLLIADPPLDEVRQGQRVLYRVNNPAVSEIYLQLGQAIGEV